MAKSKTKKKVLLVTLVKSPIGYSNRQKGTVRALGLRKMNQTVEHVLRRAAQVGEVPLGGPIGATKGGHNKPRDQRHPEQAQGDHGQARSK